MSEHIAVSEDRGILEVRIQRPERRNALTHAMYAALDDALRHAAATPAIRVVLLTGTDDCFTAGNDMQDFLNDPPKGQDSPVMRFLARLVTFEKPVVAAVVGPAVGVGTTMLLHCDLVYVGTSARLQVPFVNLGLCPEAGSSLLLPALVGHQRAAELLLLGDPVSGERAVALGLANELFDDSECLLRARAQAERLAAQPAAAVRLTKRLMRGAGAAALEAQMREEGREFDRRLGSPEAREAMTAFVEKRRPDFSQFD